MLLEEVVRLFLHSRKRGVGGAKRPARPQTLRAYEYGLEHFAGFMQEQGVVNYTQMSKAHMVSFLDWMDARKGRMGNPWSAATKLQILRTLRALFFWLEKDEDCQAEGMKSFRSSLPTIGKTPGRTYIPTMKELTTFRNAFDTKTRVGYRNFVAFSLMLGCGLRIGELSYLTVDHLKLEEKRLVVPEEGKTGTRNAPLTADMARTLKGWLRFRAKFAKSPYVFVNRSGGQCRPTAFAHAFRKLRAKHNLPKITPHTNRHAFCTYYLLNGGSMAKLKLITGHKSYEMLENYLHLAEVGGKEMQEENERVNPLRNL